MEAQRENILAGKTLANIVRTSLGPRGMDKILVRASLRLRPHNSFEGVFGEGGYYYFLRGIPDFGPAPPPQTKGAEYT